MVRDHYFDHSSCEALALYLFLLTVADRQGLSYYSDSNLMKRLNLEEPPFTQARTELIQKRLISYRKPLYQVLALESLMPPEPTMVPEPVTPPKRIKNPPSVYEVTASRQPKRSNKGPMMIKQILKHLAENNHD